ncbi:MAG: glycosyltransferase family 10 [Akkermansiaceae bacterium]|nr:glycosyltransferase family 10 [Akkermansiaceae bacterium]
MSPSSSAVGPLRVVITAGMHNEMDRFCPGRKMAWGRCVFDLNPPPGTACDYWIVWAHGRDGDRMVCAPQNTLFISGEPPAKKIYPRRFYAQFHRVVSTHAADPHPRVTTSLPGLPWHVGLDRDANRYCYGYDELAAMPFPEKSNTISAVCSHLTTTAGQRQRLAFLAFLKERLGDTLVHFGRGFRPVADKMDAILPHRCHLVLENSRSPDYWTEKLSDAYLGWAHPVYLGCPNLTDYFPANGFTPVDPERPEEALAVIRGLLASPPDPAPLAVCRALILNDYNPFARFAHWAERFHTPGLPASEVRITSHKAFRPFPRGLIHRLKCRLGRADG